MRTRPAIGAVLLLLGCDRGELDLERMLDQAKFEPYEASDFFDDTIMRWPPEGTVSRTELLGPPELRAGRRGDRYVDEIPLAVDRLVLARGQNRFGIFCAPCHGLAGDGRSRVAESMRLRRPPSLHEPRIVEFPPGRIYAAIHEGYGLMPSYAQELPIADRWAVVAYVQALQLSQRVRLAELPAELREGAKPWLE